LEFDQYLIEIGTKLDWDQIGNRSGLDQDRVELGLRLDIIRIRDLDCM
jgi:hypothetical protein